MVSEKQLIANRRNGKKGGPKTERGKSAVKLNALKHGLFSKEILLPGEDGEALEELKENMVTYYEPQSQLEAILVDRIVVCCWKMKRAEIIESGLIKARIEDARASQYVVLKDDNAALCYAYNVLFNDSTSESINRYHASAERQFFKTMNELNICKMTRQSKAPPEPDTTIVVDA